MATAAWAARQRSYEAEDKLLNCAREPCAEHPLSGTQSTTGTASIVQSAPKAAASSGASGALDPLSSSADPLGGESTTDSDPLSRLAAEYDPLSQALSATTVENTASTLPKGLDDSFEPWSAKRTGILSKYTTNEKLSIAILGSKGAAVVKSATTDKVKQRLEQLDDFDEGSVQELLDLSQADYIKRIDELNRELREAWDAEGRVKSLKIAIQCAKLLADVNAIRFYPSKFVLVTDILDTFGYLVYERILRKASYLPPGSTVPKMLPENFTVDMVPASAQETCRNWFFKIASIRELIPRFYVEAAILKCYSFLATGEYEQALMRLTSMIRGIGDPLVAVHARAYLARVGMSVAPGTRGPLMASFHDFMASFPQLSSDGVQNTLALQRVEMPAYLNLYTPALDWILQCAAFRATETVLADILNMYARSGNSALLLNSIISSFAPEYISSRAMQFVELIKGASTTGLAKHHLLRTLGVHVCLVPPPKDAQMAVLKEVWALVMKLEDPSDYINCAEVWIEYPCRYFGRREINAFLGDIVKHMQPDRTHERFLPQLQSVLSKLLGHIHDFNLLFSIDRFLPFLDLFQSADRVRTEVCRAVLEAFAAHQTEPTSDPVIIGALNYIGKTLHDSINAMTFEDEKRQIARLVVAYLSKVSFGRDFEQSLNYFVEARASFSNLDAVLAHLVHSVNMLIMRTRAMRGGRHSAKTAAFVRSCVAFNFITIPSIANAFEKLRLYVAAAEVALTNQALGQADAFVKAAINLVGDVPQKMEVEGQTRTTENELVEAVLGLMGLLLLVPDNPEERTPLHHFRSLMQAVADYTWPGDGSALVTLFTKALHLLAAYAQPKYLHHLDQVDHNDSLYAGSSAFLQEVARIAGPLLDQIATKVGASTAGPRLALDLVETLLVTADLSNAAIGTLIAKVWPIARRDAASRVTRCRTFARSLLERNTPGANNVVPHILQ